ncbi:hypothetical protein [Microvirga mediterraneensis]|uniref:Uncharacterized protein n=1 Tax=Microvirga mediterraneensis TaxID=2754695 RepID=A0A838BQP3_9HYPH|nr:hypothetical protein [Microvirga mediterraneensis]MBA1157738.1 hypothetical protein [Microvirga mediterraneensis]
MSLNKLEMAGLQECARWPDGMHFHWKRKTMEKLAAKGLVEKREGCRNGWTVAPFTGWVLTEAGKAALPSPIAAGRMGNE